MLTTVPSMIITLIIFTIAGLSYNSTDAVDIAAYSQALDAKFDISLWLLIVPIATGLMIAKRLPSIVTLFLSALLAIVFGIIFQPELLKEIAGGGEGALTLAKGSMMTLFGSTSLDAGSEQINELIATRGMSGMMDTIWLIICAMCFGGAMTAGGMIKSITSVFMRYTKRCVSLVSSTVASGLFMNLTTADQYISIILTGNMFKDIYKKCGYENRLLGRTVEDAVTVTSPLIPWNSCGMTQATVLGVSTFIYMPYCFFNYISPLMSILVASIGYKIFKVNTK